MYSAIKVNGKKLYEYARKNVEVEIQARDIEIYEIKLNTINKTEKTVAFTVKCSKGTYIRSLCEDIAEKLGTVGCMKELNRTKVGIFSIQDSITVEELEKYSTDKEKLNGYLIKIESIFSKIYGDNNKIKLDNRKLELFTNGVKLSYNVEDGLYRIYDVTSEFIGIGSIKDGLLKREIVL